MIKKECITEIHKAKSDHISWRANVQALVIDVFIDPRQLPLVHTDSKFGQWYYGKGQELSSLNSYEALGAQNEALHQAYMRLSKLYHSEPESPSLFKSAIKIKEKKSQKIEALHKEIMAISKGLIATCNQLEREVKHLTDEESQHIY
ncbi:MAG: hypothetical protein GXO35_09005 [Gammaproteobacteria bacterium]|nr:hypothetical protein [Gammaproteobacteria bacterium]